MCVYINSNKPYNNTECGVVMDYKTYLCYNNSLDCTNVTNIYPIPPCRTINEGVERVLKFIDSFGSFLNFEKSHLYYYINNGTYYANSGNYFKDGLGLFKKTFVNSGIVNNQYNLNLQNFNVVIDGSGFNSSFIGGIDVHRGLSRKYITGSDGVVVSIGNLNFIGFMGDKEILSLNNEENPYPNSIYISYVSFKKSTSPVISMILEGSIVMESCVVDQVHTGNGVSPFYFENMYIKIMNMGIYQSSALLNSFISVHDSSFYFMNSVVQDVAVNSNFNNHNLALISMVHSNFEINSNIFYNNIGKQIYLDNSNFKEEFVGFYKNNFTSNTNVNTNSFLSIVEMPGYNQSIVNSTLYRFEECTFVNNIVVDDTNNNCLITLRSVNFEFYSSNIHGNSTDCINFITFNAENSLITILDSVLPSNRFVIGKNDNIIVHNSNISNDHANYNLCIDCSYDIVSQSSSQEIKTGSESKRKSSVGETIKLVFLIIGSMVSVLLIYYLIYCMFNKIKKHSNEYGYSKIN
ncbi:hypothetical protein DICPUDRAFT_75667 [Dictyostelium purpureum]|uniref:Uncharacterized protein n=1 Tax=Dictyostelium purpureum TaxID=5786 RepID=F0ZBB6_DICPU|nr:uncharacterized protein DICPUDRAFT_75667 [Dictyostelium purpureum]EGC38745.1 hypothetical protein DICPUDRAFT_75667 [Dictyostelium purpureum]|eukprot:XP_003284736.1 hypothetical protein DICPUDRAFT_75667 [Dictyostelium purpureum]